MYELPHELTNGVILKILGNEEILRKLKIEWKHTLVPILYSKNKNW